MPQKRPKRPADLNQWAKRMVDLATGNEAEEQETAATIRGRRAGLKGGAVRAVKMTPERRAEIARRAAQARWSK